MIRVTRVDGTEQIINAELIEVITPGTDTIITLTTGRKIRVREGIAELVDRIVEYKRRIHYLTIVAERSELDEQAKAAEIKERLDNE